MIFRFPYRRVWLEPLPYEASPPPGLLARWMRLLTGKATARRPVDSGTYENVARPFVSIRIKGPIVASRLKSTLLDTGSHDTLFPVELADLLGIPLGGERHILKWRGL